MECAPGEANLASALIDSRARWRDFALLAADFVFETDDAGCFVFLAPEEVLGHAAEDWLGRPAEAMLADGGAGPFGLHQAMRGGKAWLRRADGGASCLEFAVVPFGGGLRGAARDVTAEERMGDVAARALRRATALGRLLRLGQRQGGAPAALEAMLAALPAALGAAGVAMLVPEDGRWRIVEGSAAAPVAGLPPPGEKLAQPSRLALAATESGPALMAWRAEGHAAFDADDQDLLLALALPVVTLRAEAERQRELALAALTDGLTGLLNRRGFATAMTARLRGRGGALVFIDLDGLKPLNDRIGHDAGDAALRGMADRLRVACGEWDLAGRLGGDEFCLWLDGAETMEEAQMRSLGLGAPGAVPGYPEAGDGALRASLGIALPRQGEAAEELLTRADAAMYAVKRAKGAAR